MTSEVENINQLSEYYIQFIQTQTKFKNIKRSMSLNQFQLRTDFLEYHDIDVNKLKPIFQQDQTLIHNNKKNKSFVICGLVIIFLFYRVLYEGSLKEGQCMRDVTHKLTEVINRKLNEDGDFAYYFMIVGQLFVDTQIMIFFVFQIFKMQNFFIGVWMGMFYGIRGLFLNLQKFPYPQNVYWDQPGFPPSIGVPYGITSDYFYSGHTGMMLFSVLFWSEKQQTVFLKYIAWVGLSYIILLVISSRVHYIVDVFAAIFFCLWIYRSARKYLEKFDRFFSLGYTVLKGLFQYVELFILYILRIKRRGNQQISEN